MFPLGLHRFRIIFDLWILAFPISDVYFKIGLVSIYIETKTFGLGLSPAESRLKR